MLCPNCKVGEVARWGSLIICTWCTYQKPIVGTPNKEGATS